MGKSLKGKELGIGITQRKDGRYSAKFKSRSGKRVEKYFDKLPEARKWLSEAKYEDDHGNIGSSSDMTVDAWFKYWITEIKGKTIRWSTISNYKDRYNKNIKDCIGNMVISDVRPMHCQNILNIMEDAGYAGSTMEYTKVTLSAFFSDALENGLITSNPVTKNVKCIKGKENDIRFMTVEEQEKFLNAAKESVNYLHFLFVLQTGVRSSELRGIKWEDIDFKRRILYIRRSVVYDSYNAKFITGEPKTSAGYRNIPLTPIAYDILTKIKQNRESENRKIIVLEFADHVFLNINGKLSANPGYDKCLRIICNKAGIERVTMHTLRHTFATRCIESGMKPKTLQKILGHSTISMTMDLYVHVTDNEKEKEMKKFSEMYNMA